MPVAKAATIINAIPSRPFIDNLLAVRRRGAATIIDDIFPIPRPDYKNFMARPIGIG